MQVQCTLWICLDLWVRWVVAVFRMLWMWTRGVPWMRVVRMECPGKQSGPRTRTPARLPSAAACVRLEPMTLSL